MRTIADYEKASGLSCPPDEFLCLKNTRLVFSDERKFIQSFSAPRTAKRRAAKLDKEAKRVLLRAGSVISSPHGLHNAVHEPPATTGGLRVGYRPPRYGRAAIFQLSDVVVAARNIRPWEGLVEVKGCGVAGGKIPDLGGVNTGLLFMHEALTEVISAALLDTLFNRDGMSLSTIPFYAVIDTGIRASVAWARRGLPCAALVRKSVVRPPGNNELPASGSMEEAIHHHIESYLLSRGLTTTGPITTLTMVREGSRFVARLNGEVVPQVTEEIIFLHLKTLGLYPPQIFHFANIQIARACSLDPLRACLIDLGHIRACDELPGHLVILVQDKSLNWGITTLKGSANWPQRAKQGAIDYNTFGPQLVLEGGMDEELMEWLQPTDSFRKVSEGVVCEALRLTMLVDQGRCSPEQLVQKIEEYVQRSCSTS